ncbi:MAG TPA: hypothetical protein VMB80_11905 [Candidatus Acidoferrum sp.]|nr:hypothetical protein [Candidatus Acidoferrum sp.]
MDYTRHYRSPHLMGIDADYALSRAYRSQGWPVFLVVDQSGIVRFQEFPDDKNLTRLRQCLDQLLGEPTPLSTRPAARKPEIAIPAEVLASRQARRDRSPRLALDRSGNPCVVFYSNRDGTNAVFLRRHDRARDKQDEQLSPPAAECYAADCAFDASGTLWVVWCGKAKGLYDIFIQSRPEGREPVTEPLSFSIEDAMSPKIGAGPDGTVTVAYYKWHTLWGASRDRDVYARTFDPVGRAWRPEIEISPHEPEVEDHTDPDVAVDRQGNSWIVWSYDYHPSLYPKPLDAEQPTIFAARADATTVSSPLLVGATGQFRDAVDLFPSAALDRSGVLWCAWDSSEPSRGIRLARLNETNRQFELVNSFGAKGEVCSTPELSAGTNDELLLSWSQRGPTGFWQGKVVRLKAGKPAAETVISESADVFFPQAQQGPDGQYWVAYEKSDSRGSEVVLRNITRELQRAPSP